MSICGNSTTDRSLCVSLDFDIHDGRKYPSVKDYYLASLNSIGKPIQLQKGLSNYSSLKLGDDRISFSESVISEAFRLPMEEKLMVDSPSKHKSTFYRKREYEDARNKVGDADINRMELMMKDKLVQRSFARSSPFQVRKAFKFYDREKSMRISIEGFTKALEALGFQFSEFQNLALFARYDHDYSGTIDYMDFIAKAMYYSNNEEVARVNTSHVATRRHDLNREVPDIDPEDLRILQQSELRKIFSKVDRLGSGFLNQDGFEVLLMALGYHVHEKDINQCLKDIGTYEGKLSFNSFFDWWTSDEVGASYLKRK